MSQPQSCLPAVKVIIYALTIPLTKPYLVMQKTLLHDYPFDSSLYIIEKIWNGIIENSCVGV